jgi:hypothetical protein
MTTHTVDDLAGLIKRERGGLLARWRQQVRELPSAKHLDVRLRFDLAAIRLGSGEGAFRYGFVVPC